MFKRWSKRIFIVFALMAFIIVAPLIYPKHLFVYSVVQNKLSVYSDTPIPVEQVDTFISEVAQRLKRSPVHNADNPMQIYIANTAWRRNWLWLIHLGSQVGGFVVSPITRQHAFFSGADFKTNELIAPNGFRTQQPRTLTFYGAHELTHIEISNRLGFLKLIFTPKWVREGLPDYVAMPAKSAADLYAQIGERKVDLDMIKAHGGYPDFRLLVSYFLEDAGWSVEQLLATKLTLQEAQAIVFKALKS